MCSKLISLVLTFIHFFCIQFCEETGSLLFLEIVCCSVLMFQIYYTVLKHCAPLCAGGMTARAAREKMYEHGSAVLAKSGSYSRLFHESDHSIGNRIEKSGESDADIRPKGKKNILVY
jgi:hypothetical protein